MDHGNYIDCERGQNDIWLPLRNTEGNIEFKNVVLPHIQLGDSDSAYFDLTPLKPKSVDDAVEHADKISELINQDAMEYVQWAFNCPTDRKSTLRCNREIVSDSGIVLGKKTYILRLVDDEGDRTSKLKTMGVALKRSSTSDYTKKVLSEVVNGIIEGGNKDDVMTMLRRFERDMIKQPLNMIATPSSCKTLKKAEHQYEETESYKNIARVAKAALIYNQIKHPEDPAINPGDKVYTLYTKGKIKSIAYPVDMEYHPDWLKDMTVDYAKMWSTIRKAVEVYIRAMAWDTKTQKRQKATSLFGFKN